jgi:hypothetical protein
VITRVNKTSGQCAVFGEGIFLDPLPVGNATSAYYAKRKLLLNEIPLAVTSAHQEMNGEEEQGLSHTPRFCIGS